MVKAIFINSRVRGKIEHNFDRQGRVLAIFDEVNACRFTFYGIMGEKMWSQVMVDVEPGKDQHFAEIQNPQIVLPNNHNEFEIVHRNNEYNYGDSVEDLSQVCIYWCFTHLLWCIASSLIHIFM
jgi:hypothetical protein